MKRYYYMGNRITKLEYETLSKKILPSRILCLSKTQMKSREAYAVYVVVR